MCHIRSTGGGRKKEIKQRLRKQRPRPQHPLRERYWCSRSIPQNTRGVPGLCLRPPTHDQARLKKSKVFHTSTADKGETSRTPISMCAYTPETSRTPPLRPAVAGPLPGATRASPPPRLSRRHRQRRHRLLLLLRQHLRLLRRTREGSRRTGSSRSREHRLTPARPLRMCLRLL